MTSISHCRINWDSLTTTNISHSENDSSPLNSSSSSQIAASPSSISNELLFGYCEKLSLIFFLVFVIPTTQPIKKSARTHSLFIDLTTGRHFLRRHCGLWLVVNVMDAKCLMRMLSNTICDARQTLYIQLFWRNMIPFIL